MYYYPHHIGDYLSHTAHLSLLEHGIYLRLLQTYYRYEKPLLESEAPRQIGAKDPNEVEAVHRILAEYFVKTPQGYTNKRADEELTKFHAKSKQARTAANARWSNDMRTHTARNADAMPTNNQYPITNSLSIPTSKETSPLLVSSIDILEVDDADASTPHKSSIDPASKPPYSPPIAPLSGNMNLSWAYKLKAREEAGEELSVAQKRNWREALRVRA